MKSARCLQTPPSHHQVSLDSLLDDSTEYEEVNIYNDGPRFLLLRVVFRRAVVAALSAATVACREVVAAFSCARLLVFLVVLAALVESPGLVCAPPARDFRGLAGLAGCSQGRLSRAPPSQSQTNIRDASAITIIHTMADICHRG